MSTLQHPCVYVCGCVQHVRRMGTDYNRGEDSACMQSHTRTHNITHKLNPAHLWHLRLTVCCATIQPVSWQNNDLRTIKKGRDIQQKYVSVGLGKALVNGRWMLCGRESCGLCTPWCEGGILVSLSACTWKAVSHYGSSDRCSHFVMQRHGGVRMHEKLVGGFGA